MPPSTKLRINNQIGAIPLLVLIAVIGLISVLIVVNFAPFKDRLLSSLFPKNSSFAASAPTTANFGKMNLSATFNSIGIELFFSGNASASAQLEFKKSTDSIFRKGLDLWATNDGSTTPGPAFYGSALLLSPGTSYDIKVTLNDPGQTPSTQTLAGSITTRAEDIPPVNALIPSHFVRSDGNDANTGTANTASGAWKTLHKAITTAPANAVVMVSPGYYASPGSVNKDLVRSTTITFLAEKPAVDDNRNIINPGQHSVVENGVITSPTGAPSANPGVWTKVNLVGPATGGTYSVWKWTTPYTASYPTVSLGYAQTREGLPQRIASWDLKSGTVTDKSGKVWYLKNTADATDASGWAEVLYNNKLYNYGFAAFGADVYVRIQGDLNPNSYFITLNRSATGGSDGFAFNAANVRFSGFEVRQVFTTFKSASSFGVVDHNLFVTANVTLSGTKPGTYGSDHLIERNRFVDSSLFSATGTDQFITWSFIKGGIILPDGTVAPWSRVGSGSGGALGAELTAVSLSGGAKRSVIRYNTIDGMFNGIGSNNTGYDRYSAQDIDSHDNLIVNVNDDAFEPEQQIINWRIWNNRIENASVALSTGPVYYGPIYFFRNSNWRIGGQGNVNDQTGSIPNSGIGFKYSGGGTITKGRVYVVNNSFWTNSPFSVSGGAQAAGGGSNSENFYLRNNLFRMTRYGFDAPGYAGKWNEDYNFFSTTDPTRGMNYGSANKTTVSTYRTSSGQGEHTNLSEMDPTQNFHSLPDNWLTNPLAGDLTLKTSTPVIDAGITVANITESFTGSAPDIGACEGNNCLASIGNSTSTPSSSPSPSVGGAPTPLPSATPSASAAILPGDVNADNKIDIFDYNILLTNFGKTGSGFLGDIDNSGKVDIFDYNILLSNFGK